MNELFQKVYKFVLIESNMKLKNILTISSLVAFMFSACPHTIPTPTKTNTPEATPTPTEQCTPTQSIEEIYNIGDRGPAGGWIFYDKGVSSDGWRYLEAAPADQTKKVWGTYNYVVSGADGTVIGTGKQNTLDIIAGDSLENKAANACADYSTVNNGITYDDWFLPSRDELNEMYLRLKEQGIGDFADSSYWTSSEGISTDAKAIVFFNGLSTHHYKNTEVRSRPIREAN